MTLNLRKDDLCTRYSIIRSNVMNGIIAHASTELNLMSPPLVEIFFYPSHTSCCMHLQ